jgi:hypothetical protein
MEMYLDLTTNPHMEAVVPNLETVPVPQETVYMNGNLGDFPQWELPPPPPPLPPLPHEIPVLPDLGYAQMEMVNGNGNGNVEMLQSSDTELDVPDMAMPVPPPPPPPPLPPRQQPTKIQEKSENFNSQGTIINSNSNSNRGVDSPKVDSRSELMAAIRQGTSLRKVDVANLPKKEKGAMDDGKNGGLDNTLKNALASRRTKIFAGDGESESENDSDMDSWADCE